MHAYNRLTVNLDAIKSNLVTIRQHLSPNNRIMPMVKANGYGTDAFSLANFYIHACGVDILGVSHVQEAIALREKGLKCALFVIAAPIFEVSSIVTYDLEVAVDDLETCQQLSEAALKQGKIASVHLHVDTGMRRFGCRLEQALSLAEAIQRLPGLKLAGVMSHFVAAESQNFDLYSQEQTSHVETLLFHLHAKGIRPQWIHLANSAGVARFPLHFCNMTRIGLLSFGIFSSLEEKKHLSLTPSLNLETTIVGINHCHLGESVGYSRHYKASRSQEKIAILSFGYHDGLHLHHSGKGYVLIHGKKAPRIGRICMDFMMVDVTDIPEAKIGDTALLFGEDKQKNTLPLETVAEWGSTNVREMMVSLGPRVARSFSTLTQDETLDVYNAKNLLPTSSAI